MSKTEIFVRKSKAPIPFDALHPGSLYVIHAERSRGHRFSRDNSVYQKARDGYYSTSRSNPERAIVLYPNDLVWPVAVKQG